MLPKKGGQHGAHQQDIEYIVPGLFENPAVNEGGRDAHEHHVHGKRQIGIGGDQTARAQEKDDCRMDEGVQRVHAQQTGGHNGIVDDRLKDDGRAADGEGRNEHDDKLGGAQLHGVLE